MLGAPCGQLYGRIGTPRIDRAPSERCAYEFFLNRLEPAKGIDFADGRIQASGVGRTRVRLLLEAALGLRRLEEMAGDQRLVSLVPELCRLLDSTNSSPG